MRLGPISQAQLCSTRDDAELKIPQARVREGQSPSSYCVEAALPTILHEIPTETQSRP